MNSRLPKWVSNSVLLCFFIFLVSYVVVSYENTRLKEAYSQLESSQNFSFATIQEISRIKNRFPIIYQCQYSFSLPDGTQAESSETIPYSIYKKLKLGDPIVIFRMETMLFGRRIAISKIGENSELPPLIDNLERFFRGGLIYFSLIGIFSLFVRVWVSQSQTYPYLQK